MAEHKRVSASEIVKRLRENPRPPLGPDELRTKEGGRLLLQIGCPEVEVDDTVRVQSVLDRLSGEDVREGVALRNAEGFAEAVVLPTRRYLQLAAKAYGIEIETPHAYPMVEELSNVPAIPPDHPAHGM